MTLDDAGQVIAFVVGGLVLLWGFRSLAFASGGGERSGLHELGTASIASSGDSEDAPEPSGVEAAAVAEASYRRRERMYQVANYALSLAAMAALTAMLIGAALA